MSKALWQGGNWGGHLLWRGRILGQILIVWSILMWLLKGNFPMAISLQHLRLKSKLISFINNESAKLICRLLLFCTLIPRINLHWSFNFKFYWCYKCMLLVIINVSKKCLCFENWVYHFAVDLQCLPYVTRSVPCDCYIKEWLEPTFASNLTADQLKWKY